MGIELIDVTSGYRKREYILKNINLKIDHNTIILGPNGRERPRCLEPYWDLLHIRKERYS